MFPLLFFLLTQDFEDGSSEAIADQLQALKDNPISLNTARKEDLTKIYWISPELAEDIIKTRTKKNGFKKIAELKDVPGMTTQVFENIKPYIVIKPVSGLINQAPTVEIRERAQKTIPEEEGNLGSSEKVYQRIKLKYKNVSGVLLSEKDAYEKSYSDFLTYGLVIEQFGRIQKIALGDYALDFGEGLLFGMPPLITFKNQGILKGKSTGIRQYTISGENTFLRGVALEYKLPKSINNFIFYSNAELDARIDSTDTTIYYDYEGDHSTETGLSKKDKVKEELFGTRLEYTRMPKLGVTCYKNTYFLNPDGSTPSTSFGTSSLTTSGNKIGSHNLLSFDFSSIWHELTLFGEVGNCDAIWAQILGMEYRTKKMKTGVLRRNYPSGFYIFHASPWSDRTTTTGNLAERGNYFYGSYDLSKHTILYGYIDNFTRLARTNEELSEQGTEYSGEIEHRFTPEIIGRAKYSHQKIDTIQTTRFRLQTDFSIKAFEFRIRMERDYEALKIGNLWYGNVEWNFMKNSAIAVRIISFDAEARVYESEMDLPGLMTSRCFTGEGTRTYCYLRQRVTSAFTISFKYETTLETETQEKYGIQVDFIPNRYQSD